MTPERAAELYRTADTPQKAAELIAARGRPDLAIYILGFARVPPAKTSAELFRIWSNVVGVETGFGWYEKADNISKHNPPTLENARQVRAIFRWLVDVFTRYAPLQPPPPPDEPIALACETCGKFLAPGRDCCPPPKIIPVAGKKRRRAKRST